MFIEREQRVFHKYRPRTTLQQISPFWRPPRKWPSTQESESTTFSSSLIKNPPSWKSTAERLQNRQKFRRNSQRITTMSAFRCDSYSTWLKPKKCLGFQRQALDWSFLRIFFPPRRDRKFGISPNFWGWMKGVRHPFSKFEWMPRFFFLSLKKKSQ